MTGPDIIAIFGPTGVGKTAVAAALAEHLRARGEDPAAVSADALQIYQGLEVLTGAADALAEDRLEHRLVACVAVDESFSAGRFAALAHAEIDSLLADGRRPIVVGGTGLYLRAALADLDLQPPVDDQIRAAVQERLATQGPAQLHAELSTRAPGVAARIAPGDTQRITRALELLEAGTSPREDRQQLWTEATRHRTLLVGLTLDRSVLYDRIERRVALMLEAGAAEEVRRAAAAGAGPSARKAVGFRELLAGDSQAMVTRSRQYARRQLTWMRKLPGALLLDMTGRSPDETAAEIIARLDAR